MAFLASFLQYFICAVILVLVAFIGGFLGKKLRDAKDRKTAPAAAEASPNEATVTADEKTE